MTAQKKTISIINYGLGNLHSVHKALLQVANGWRVVIASEPEQVLGSDKVVFPGVGAIGACMQGLRTNALEDALKEAAASKSFLAICVGLQALFGRNEEDANTCGLDILKGDVRRFSAMPADCKIPHMGWNRIYKKRESPLLQGIKDGSYMYFVHSYYVQPKESSDILATCEYGASFTAICVRDQLVGCQFHPEKSHATGIQLLRNFVHEM